VVGGFEWLTLQPIGDLPAVPHNGCDEASGGGGGGSSWYGFGTIARGAVSVMGSISNIVYATVAVPFIFRATSHPNHQQHRVCSPTQQSAVCETLGTHQKRKVEWRAQFTPCCAAAFFFE
jgi:hypothetical protein